LWTKCENVLYAFNFQPHLELYCFQPFNYYSML